jgi:hypothetical protein
MDEQSSVAAVAALQASLVSTNVSFDYFESDDVRFSSNSEDLGRVDASVSATARDLVVCPLRKRVPAGAEATFRITSSVHQEPDSRAAASIAGIARILLAEIELVSGDLVTSLEFSVTYAAGGDALHGCVDLVVSVPEDAEGSEIVLRRVSVAGCDMALDEAPVRLIVGFNHEPARCGPWHTQATSPP